MSELNQPGDQRWQRPTDASSAGNEQALATLRREALSCRRCRLADLRTQVVFGAGNAHTPLVLVGQSPGEREDQSGLPFIGPAGQLLNECLAEIGIRRDQVWITNIVKCRPFEIKASRRGLNRDPLPDEVDACAPWLVAELALLAPLVIVCIGAPSARLILGRNVSVTRERGTWHTQHRFAPAQVLAVLHPAYILRHQGAERDRLRDQFTEDLELARKMAARLRKAQREAAATAAGGAAGTAHVTQLSLFDSPPAGE